MVNIYIILQQLYRETVYHILSEFLDFYRRYYRKQFGLILYGHTAQCWRLQADCSVPQHSTYKYVTLAYSNSKPAKCSDAYHVKVIDSCSELIVSTLVNICSQTNHM